MFKRVLLCYDGSAAGRRALRRGAELAILVNAHVHVLSIKPTGAADPVVAAGVAGTPYLVGNDDGGRRSLDESLQWLRARGVTAEGYLTAGNTFDEIVKFTKRLGTDLIVLGHYPQPSGGFWWGSGRGSLAERSNCCVFVAVDAPGDPNATAPAPITPAPTAPAASGPPASA
jgi:nucleotide-binding universal stress UspA family protein